MTVAFRLAVFPGVLALSLALAPCAFAWGPGTHQRITAEAIEALPKGMKAFYKAHRLELPSLSLEASPTDDAPDRRFAVDRLLAFPFTETPLSEAALKSRFPDKAAEVGRLPWLVRESYARLVQAFKSGDKVTILAESDALSSLVADLANPLAVTENADGQKSGQHGLWVRFSVRLPEVMDRRLKLRTEAARYLDAPDAHVFTMVNASYIWLDNLLYEEDIARRGQNGYTETYYDAFALRAGRLLEDRLSHAATEVASYWYSAWTAAGRPALK